MGEKMFRKSVSLLAAVALSVSAVVLGATGASASTSAAPTAPRTLVVPMSDPAVPQGTIRGIVSDAQGTAIEAMSITLYGEDQNPVGDPVSTDALGAYEFSGLTDGTYYLMAGGSPEFQSQWWNGVADEGMGPANATPITIGNAGATANFSMVAYGAISGHVEAFDTHEPVANVQVCYYSDMNGSCGDVLTDGNGDFTIHGLAAGDYKLFYSTMQTNMNYRSTWFPGSDRESGATKVSVHSGETAIVTGVELQQGSVIRGVLSTPDGEEAPTSVSAYISNYGYFDYYMSGLTANVQGDGSFEFIGLSPGAYKVKAGRTWYGNQLRGALSPVIWLKTSTERDLGTIQGIALESSISGTLTDSSGQPIAGASVVAEPYASEDMQNSLTATTDELGAYTIAVPSGTYAIKFSDEIYWGGARGVEPRRYLFVGSNDDRTGVDMEMPGGSISGQVTDSSGQALPDVSVSLWRSSGSSESQWTQTDQDGNYSFAGVGPDTYTLSYSATGYGGQFLGQAAAFSQATFFDVQDGESVTNDIVMSPASIVKGRLVGDTHLANSTAYLTNDAGRASWFGTFAEQVASNGRFTIRDVAAGKYRLEFWPAYGATWSRFWLGGKTSKAESTRITVASQSTKDLGDISVKNIAAGRISGKVTARDTGLPLHNLAVVLINKDRTGFGDMQMPEEDGTYSFTGIAPGQYTVWFAPRYTWANWMNGDGFESNSDYLSLFWGGSQNIGSAKPVTIQDGDSLKMNMSLPRGASVSGRVSTIIDGELTYLANATVDVYDSAGRVAGTTTGDDGTYSIRGLEQGAYFVKFSASSLGLAQTWFDDRQALYVGLGQEKSDIDADLLPGSSLSGTVLFPAGHDVDLSWNNRIQVFDASSGDLVDYTWADGGGHFFIEGLGEGSYQLKASVGSFAPEWLTDGEGQIETVDLLAGEARANVDIPLHDGASISGHVTRATDSTRGVGALNVVLTDETGAEIARSTTSSTGFYEFPGLGGGVYKVHFGDSWNTSGTFVSAWYNSQSSSALKPNAAESITLTDGQNRTDVDGHLAASSCGVSAGNVLVQGNPSVGQTLTAQAEKWGPGTVTFTYQWQREESGTHRLVDIPGATSKQYTLTEEDGAARVYALVRGYSAGCDPVLVGNSTHVLVSSPPLVAPTVTPTISGEAKSGSLLTARAAAAPVNASRLFQWLRDAAPIDGATGSTYTPTSDDIGAKLSVVVSYVRTGFDGSALTSASTKDVSPADFVLSTKPSIPASIHVGVAVSVDVGSWSPAPTSYTYKWLRNGKAILNATSASYTPVAADLGRKLTVQVKGSREGYSSLVVTTPLGRLVTR
jgi:hypothetical protein